MILNAGNLSMAMVFVVTSIWGMNLSDNHTESYVLFTLVSFLFHDIFGVWQYRLMLIRQSTNALIACRYL